MGENPVQDISIQKKVKKERTESNAKPNIPLYGYAVHENLIWYFTKNLAHLLAKWGKCAIRYLWLIIGCKLAEKNAFTEA